MRWCVLVLAISACGSGQRSATTQALTARASFDLNCPENDLRWSKLDEYGTVWGASGCGGRATYVYSALTRQWIMNARAENTNSAAAPQSGPPAAGNQQGVTK